MKGKDGQDGSLNLSQSSIGMSVDGDLSGDSITVAGKLGQKGEFDRRQKKKWV